MIQPGTRCLVLIVGAMILGGCKKAPEPQKQGDPLLDTGWFVDTADPANCVHKMVLSDPQSNDDGWYWLDPLKVYVESDDEEQYDIALVDDNEVSVPSFKDFSENLYFDVMPRVGNLEANTDYRLIVTDCLAIHEIPFRTSEYGEPLENGPSRLPGHTYNLELVTANWVQPGGLGTLLALYFNTPILMGVQYADQDTIDFLAAPGLTAPTGEVAQDITQSSWDFPATGFEDSPYFSAYTNEVVFLYEGSEIPVGDFTFSGTIAGDMSSIGGGVITGIADTRNLGEFVGASGDEGAMCETAESLGVSCINCDDGQPYCLEMEVTDVEGELVDGLELQP